MRSLRAEYSTKETALVAHFTEKLREEAAPKGTFDSAAADEFVSNVSNLSASSTGVELPAVWNSLVGEMSAQEQKDVCRATLDAVGVYEKLHGVAPTGDVIEWAMHQGYGATEAGMRKAHVFDDASSDHHDQTSLQPNRAVVAITAAIVEAIPIANYLPADIGSNEARLVIVSHIAGSTIGSYKQNDLMDGISSGGAYISSSRMVRLDADGAAKVTSAMIDHDTCDPAAGPVKLLRGRALVYLNGLPAGREIDSTGSAVQSPLSGTVTMGGTEYAISGYIEPDTGNIKVTTSPKLPANVPVHVQSFIDFERLPDLTPRISTNAQVFKLFANPWRVITEQTIDSRKQFDNELGIDASAEAMYAVRYQFANERHYEVLRMARMIAANNAHPYNFKWIEFGLQKTRAQCWQDASPIFNRASQQMANETMDHGITHCYTGALIMSQLVGLPDTIWEPSGVEVRPGIYRIGRLFGQYEFYYDPTAKEDQAAGTAEIICIGRSSQVARNPFVLGDAVPPIVQPLAFDKTMKYGAGFYARNFTNINPHVPSARGVAVINVTGLF